MHSPAPLRILSNAESLDQIFDHAWSSQPSRSAILEPAPSDTPIESPHEIAGYELDAACIYALALESRMIRAAAKAVKAYLSSNESQQKKAIVEKACKGLNNIQREVSNCLAEYSFPCAWIELPIPERQQLITKLPFVISQFQENWPLNILDADPAGVIAPTDWLAKVVAPVGSGYVRTGHFAVNFSYKNEPIIEEFKRWLIRHRERIRQRDKWTPQRDFLNNELFFYKGGKDTLRQLSELRFRSRCKRDGKTFNDACYIAEAKLVLTTNQEYPPRTYHNIGESNEACEAAIREFEFLFQTSELPIHADWRPRPKRKSSSRTRARSKSSSAPPNDHLALRRLDWGDSIPDKAANLRIGDLIPDDQERGHEIIDIKTSPPRVREIWWNTNGKRKEVNRKSKPKVCILFRSAAGWTSYAPDQEVRRSRRTDDVYA